MICSTGSAASAAQPMLFYCLLSGIWKPAFLTLSFPMPFLQKNAASVRFIFGNCLRPSLESVPGNTFWNFVYAKRSSFSPPALFLSTKLRSTAALPIPTTSAGPFARQPNVPHPNTGQKTKSSVYKKRPTGMHRLGFALSKTHRLLKCNLTSALSGQAT